jgi:Mitochondrial ribosomal protein (VAR1)
MMISEYKKINSLGCLLNKHKHHPLVGGENILQKSPDLAEINKQIFFPLTSLHSYRKESFLNKTSTDYLKSLHPTKMRVNLNEAPSKEKTQNNNTKFKGYSLVSTKSSDVLYEYLKSFSKYRKRKTGLIIKQNQHIVYNFTKKRLIKTGDEALYKKAIKKIIQKLTAKILKNKSTFGVPDIAKATENINKNNLLSTLAGQTSTIAQLLREAPKREEKEKFSPNLQPEGTEGNKDDLLNKHLLGLSPESNKKQNTPFVNKHRTLEPNAPLTLDTEIPQDLNLRLKELNNLSLKTRNLCRGNNRLIKYSYKLLFYFFKSMYCLISKPVFLVTPDKVVIQLKYFLNIPKYKVFKFYSIFKNKLIRKKREALIKQKEQIKKRERLEKENFKFRIQKSNNLQSGVELARVLNPLENLSSNHTFNSERPTKKTQRSPKLHWKVAKTLQRLNNKLRKKILFNLNKYNLFRVFSPKFKLICEILNKKFKKPVEFQLIRIHQPYQDSNILANLLSLNIRNKKFKTNVKIEKLFQKRVVKNVYDYNNKSVNFIPTFLSGINIRIGGRLMREKIIPRISHKTFERGARSIGKVNYLDSASITNKNRKGSYTLKISSGQNFF